MRTQIHPDRDYKVEVNRRKLTFDCSVSSTLTHSDHSPSIFGCSSDVDAAALPTVITWREQDKIHGGELGCKKKRARVSPLLRSGMSLCPYLAIIFLLAGTPSVVRAQAQNDTIVAPSASVNAEVPDPAPSGTDGTGTIPTTTSAPTARPVVSVPSTVTPGIPMPTPEIVATSAPTENATLTPTSRPTLSMEPTVSLSDLPSFVPSVSLAPTSTPSDAPTAQPSWKLASTKETKFRQEFEVGNGREFTDDELNLFQTIYQRYTVDFAPLPKEQVELKIETVCTVDKQTFLVEVGGERQLEYDTDSSANLRRGRRMQDDTVNPNIKTLNVDYTMKYESFHYNVTNYPKLFQSWVTGNLDLVRDQMQFLNIDVISVNIPKRIVVSTPAPSVSSVPSIPPSYYPTISDSPTATSTEQPSTSPTPSDQEGSGKSNIIIISVSLVIAFSIISIGLFLYYRKRQTNRQNGFGVNGTKRTQARGGAEMHGGMGWPDSPRAEPNPAYGTSDTKAYGSSYGRHSDVPSRLADAVSSPPGSLVSSQSLISRGNSMGGDSREEEDTAHILVDEFDQYKDQNLEKMRADIEDLPECDGMMSQAVAKALIDQDDETIISSSYWGGDHDVTAPEIEASALGFVLDWLKRNGKVSDREKREMMQEQLNKMTASVLHKVIGPDDATRTIHECAVLLGLKLASELTVTTILISGMRKKATEADIRRTFSVFGDVAVAAVAPNERGFGILRFKSNNAVNRAMGKFRTEEIVVEDVAVQLIVIKAGLNSGGADENGSSEII